MLTKKEIAILVQFMADHQEAMCNACCNDWNFPKDWTHEEKEQFVKEFHEYNGDPAEFDPEFLRLNDFSAHALLIHKLEKLLAGMP